MPLPPASGDLNSHSELSGWTSSRMPMMQVFVFYYVCQLSLKLAGLPLGRYGRLPVSPLFRWWPWPVTFWHWN